MRSWPVRMVQLAMVYAGALALAALLTPWITALLQEKWPTMPPERVFDRLRYLGVLLALPLVWQWAGWQNWGQIGWKRWRGGIGLMAAGAASVCLVGAWCAWGKTSTAALSNLEVINLVIKGVSIGLAVALVEEIVFRGLLQRILVRSGGRWLGIGLASLIYAWLHGRPQAAGDSWGLAWAHLSQWPADMSLMMLVNLTLLGAALGILYEKSRSLWWPIGLHAGIVAAALPVSTLLRKADPTLGKTFMLEHPATTVMLVAWVALAAGWRAQPKDGNDGTAKEKTA